MLNSRQKGKRGELELADYLRAYGHDARRGQQFSGSPDSPDIVSQSLGGFHVECKRVEAGNPYAWLDQAQKDCGDKTPIVFHKKNRREWMVIMDANDFMELLP